MLFYYHHSHAAAVHPSGAPHTKEETQMETIAVIGSNMVDLVTYVARMPARGETLEAPNFELGCGGKGRTRPSRPPASARAS